LGELSIRVIPRAGKAGPAGMRDGALLVRLNAPPVEGAANRELVAILSRLFDVPKRCITIVAGDRNRNKRVRIADVDDDGIERTIAGLGFR
jgi:uncharacterized protein